MAKKVFVLGIDGLSPEKVLEWRNELPTLSRLMSEGWYARIRSTIPPTSIAAWSSLFSGRDPGELDIFGYTRKSKPPKYELSLVNSSHVKAPRVWDTLAHYGKKSIIFGAPLTYPASPIDGIMITDFMTPGFGSNCVYPESLKKEIQEILSGPLVFDVSEFANYRNMDHLEMIEKIWKLTEDHFKVAFHLMKNKPWDFFAFVNYGSDRLHHTLWRYTDSTHKRYTKHPILSEAIKNFYKFLDGKIAELISLLPGDTALIISSDHGVQKMNGRFNINDWLMREGILALSPDFADEIKTVPKKINLSRIDWTKTKAYSLGAYECFIYINKSGREEQGIVPPEEYDSFTEELIGKLKTIRDDDGRLMQTQIYKARDIYKSGYSDEAPDLVVYFDNLFWGVNSDLGNKGLYSWANLVGPDDALHSTEGLFIMHDSSETQKGEHATIDINEVAPKIFNLLGTSIK